MSSGVPRRRRARPVGDAPVDALLARSEALTKGWLVAVLEQAPLEHAAGILAADLSRDGPRVCDAVIRALASEDELRRLEPGGALEHLVARAGDLAGVAGPLAASGVIDALHDVIWSAIQDELYHPEPEQVAELAQRLRRVTEVIRASALRRMAGAPGLPGPAEAEAPVAEPPVAEAEPEASAPPPVAPPEPEAAPAEPDAAPAGDPEAAPAADEPRAEDRREQVRSQSHAVHERQIAAVPAPPEPSKRHGEALWIGAFEEEIARAERSGTPLSLLLIELEDGERLRAIEPPAIAGATLGRFAQAVRDAVRRPDIIASETDTRAWVIAHETGRSGAHQLASRLGRAVRSSAPWRGAPMAVSIGVGVLGEDGRDVDSLIEAAEESRFAAAASGVEVVRGNGEDPGDVPGAEDLPT